MRGVGVQALVLIVIGSGYCNPEREPVKKCHELPGEDTNKNLEEALHTYQNCFISNRENFRHTVPSKTCTNTTLEIRKCDDNIVKNIDECKSSDEQHFPKTVFKIVSDYAAYICLNAASYKFPVLLDHKICFPSLASGISCFEKFRFFNTTATVSKEEMCSDEMEVKECLLNYANETCSQDTVFLKLVNNTFNFDKPPCTGGATGLATCYVIFFISVVFAVLSQMLS